MNYRYGLRSVFCLDSVMFDFTHIFQSYLSRDLYLELSDRSEI